MLMIELGGVCKGGCLFWTDLCYCMSVRGFAFVVCCCMLPGHVCVCRKFVIFAFDVVLILLDIVFDF